MAPFINKTATIIIAETSPNLPMSSAMVSSFYYKGVVTSSPPLNRAWILPRADKGPTAITTILPSPDKIREPESTRGEGTSCVEAPS